MVNLWTAAAPAFRESGNWPRQGLSLMLEAMRAARFAILILGRRHDAAGVIATDLFRRTDVWLVDIGLEASLEEGAMMATRLYTPEQFSMTAGVNVPFDLALIEDLYDALPRRLGETRLTDLIDDRRFAETSRPRRRHHGSRHLPRPARRRFLVAAAKGPLMTARCRGISRYGLILRETHPGDGIMPRCGCPNGHGPGSRDSSPPISGVAKSPS